MAGPGTRDVTLDLTHRTSVNATDLLMVVNPTTKEVQVLQVQNLPNVTIPPAAPQIDYTPSSSDTTFIIV
jgi:hypothetical protein